MHQVGENVTSVPVANRTEEDLQRGIDGQDTPSESSIDSCDSDTTGDEEWDSGESSASLVVNHIYEKIRK